MLRYIVVPGPLTCKVADWATIFLALIFVYNATGPVPYGSGWRKQRARLQGLKKEHMPLYVGTTVRILDNSNGFRNQWKWYVLRYAPPGGCSTIFRLSVVVTMSTAFGYVIRTRNGVEKRAVRVQVS